MLLRSRCPHPTTTVVPAKAGTHNTVSKQYYVYMLASSRYGTLYVGVTSNLIKRTWQHREGFVDGFANKHSIKRLVWYEAHDDAHAAITREKQIKKWERAWKIRLIQERNPHWRDLFDEVAG